MTVPSIFNAVLKASIFGSVVGIIIFILKSTVLKKLPFKWQYCLWFVMIVKLIFPNGPESSISVFNKINVTQIITENDLLKIAKKAVPIVSDTQNNVNIFAYVYLLGFAVSAIWAILSFAMLKYKIHKSSQMPSEKTLEILENCKKIASVNKNIKVIVQNHISATSLCGLIKPKILITKDFENQDTSCIEYAFIHELSHYKRKDIAMNYLIIILQCVHFFNPVVWFLFGKLRRDTELAADEKTMLYLNPQRHKEYGMALINSMSAKFGKAPYILGMATNKKDIKKRIKAIAKFKKPRLIQHILSVATVLFIASVCLTSAVIAKPISEVIYQSMPSFVLPDNKSDIIVEKEAVPPQNEDEDETFKIEQATDEAEPEQEKTVITDGEEEYLCFEGRSIDAIISMMGQALYSGSGTVDLKQYAKLISYNSNDEGKHTFVIKPNNPDHIQILVEENSVYDHEIYVDISNTKTPGNGWRYRFSTGSGYPFMMQDLNPNEEYIVEISAYCPGFYAIEGRILIY